MTNQPGGEPNPDYGNLYVTWARYYPSGQLPGFPNDMAGSEAMIGVSSDGGQTWTPLKDEVQLPEPRCQASILRYDWPEEERRGRLLFANPANLEPAAMHAFLAHELGHQLTYDRWNTLGPDRRLTEGLATYAAEPHWLAWRGWPTLDAGVAGLLAAHAFDPIGDEPRGCLVASQRDTYYSAWASFVGYLVRRYGWERFGEVLRLAAAAEDRGDYVDAFGLPLEDLVAAWERTLP